jgi:alpha-galactosidase
VIHYHEKSRTFTLVGQSSFYALAVNSDGRLVHLDSGPRPPMPDSAMQLTADVLPDAMQFCSHDMLDALDEIMTFGDAADYEVALKVNLPGRPANVKPGEAHRDEIRDLRLRYRSHQILDDAKPGLVPAHNQKTRIAAKRQTLRITLADPVYPFEVSLFLRLTPENDVIERWIELANTGDKPVRVEQCYFGTVHLPPGRYELIHPIGGHAREFTTCRDLLPAGLTILESRTLTTSLAHNPAVLLTRPGQVSENAGDVYFAALAYSGNWRITLEYRPNLLTTLHAGYSPFDFDLTLAPGERHATPALVHGCCAGGFNAVSHRLHSFTRDRVIPRPDSNPSFLRPVLYNSWEATWFDIRLEHQMELARRAAAIGVELFCVDDGWFAKRNSDKTSLGDWVLDPARFPNGFTPLIDEVHRLGMKFGLWFEPEMVNPDSDLYRKHPDWVLHYPGRPRTVSRNQLILDFGRSEVVEHVFNALDTMLSQYPIDFLKWDMNRPATEAGSPVGKNLWRIHTLKVYEIMDCLRVKYPGLAIESCSSGGGRIDLGVLARTDQVWTSDNTDALDRVGIQEGFSLTFPARAMACWVTNRQNPETKRILELPLRFDVAMRGILGIGSNIDKLDDDELKQYAQFIAFYKKIRPIVQLGRCFRLQDLADYGASAVQYVNDDASQAVYSTVIVHHHKGQVRPRAILRNLTPDARYNMTDKYGKPRGSMTGAELMTLGLPIYLNDGPCVIGYSQTLVLTRS